MHTSVSSLSYIGKATESLNIELEQLSVLNKGQDIVFDTGASDPSQFVDNLRLAAQVGDKTLSVGGDGRNNQIHLALWSARNRPVFSADEEPLELSIFCIEEPEAHLHPHQQRKLANYLSEVLHAQVIITTHSPQIACEFPPASIIRFYDNNPDTLAAGDGSNPFIKKSFIDFGYRLNIIPAETFFSNVVLLVEGPSEELFYKALAKEIGIDLDRLNISILMVDGVGFDAYISLLHSLNIDYVVRTDNDIFKIPRSDEYRYAGIQRGIEIYRSYFEPDKDFEEILKNHENQLRKFDIEHPPDESAQLIIEALEDFDIFLADADLENDLKNSEMGIFLEKYFGNIAQDGLVEKMQKRKATFMFNFLTEHSDSLKVLRDSDLVKPLLRSQEIANSYGNPQSD
jgi:putative ATP-dependent endonuclease of OLD family